MRGARGAVDFQRWEDRFALIQNDRSRFRRIKNPDGKIRGFSIL
jgi:hypothetical protein